MSTALVVVGLALSFIYLVVGVIIAVEYPNHGSMPKTRFGRFLFRIILIVTWLLLLGIYELSKALKWLFS